MSKVLIVTTSHDRFEGENPKPTGVWLEEFAVPYLEFWQNGLEIAIASPKGGEMPIDPRSLPTPEQEKAWEPAISASKNTVTLDRINAAEFDAIFLPGGHGPMFDLPQNPDLQRLLGEFHETGKIIAAVCHGPAGLVGATLADGTPLVKNKVITSFTNSEEKAVGLEKEVPFSLEDRLRDLGGIMITHTDFNDHIERDGKLITGQNPNSSSSIARALINDLNGQLPAIFDRTPEAIVPAQTIAEFPAPTFLENIAIDSQGIIFVTSYEDGKIYRITPNGDRAQFASIDGNVAGIAVDNTGNLIVAASVGRQTATIFRIDATGTTEAIVTLPEAIFLNGITHLQGDVYLIADSYKGAIWAVDVSTKTGQIWIADSLLARSDNNNPFPAVNGIKIYQNALFASNTQRQLLIQIPLGDNGNPEQPEVFLTNVNLDDFAFDERGNLYGTTHVYNSTIRISPDKQIATIATAEQGMTGNTAIAFGRTSNDKTSIYVTTNGGMSLPPATGLEPAKVVRLEVGIAGATR
jgi:putative intracellular protease/amidase/sugar lactone lactonase YvrE